MSDKKTNKSFNCGKQFCRAFTMVELLVVIAVIALLLAVLTPSLLKAKHQAKLVICASNLRNIGTVILSYSHEYDDTIPFGPENPPLTATNFYTATGNVTNLLSLENGTPVGLGLLLGSYVEEQSKIFFCPGTDQHSDAKTQLAKVGKEQAQSDYYYRHASVAMLAGTPDVFHIRLNHLGKNRNGKRISALVMDVQFLANPSLAAFGVTTRTSHDRKAANILFADGQVVRQNNEDDRFTVDIGYMPYDALDKILQVFERADELR